MPEQTLGYSSVHSHSVLCHEYILSIYSLVLCDDYKDQCTCTCMCILQELAEIRQVLEVRELKMVEMSRESISLRETNQSLEEQLTEARRTGQTDVDELRSEFTRRLATAEKKFQAVVKVSEE